MRKQSLWSSPDIPGHISKVHKAHFQHSSHTRLLLTNHSLQRVCGALSNERPHEVAVYDQCSYYYTTTLYLFSTKAYLDQRCIKALWNKAVLALRHTMTWGCLQRSKGGREAAAQGYFSSTLFQQLGYGPIWVGEWRWSLALFSSCHTESSAGIVLVGTPRPVGLDINASLRYMGQVTLLRATVSTACSFT